jgi:signal recognition particle GTPase
MVFRALFKKVKAGLAKTRGVFTGVAQLFRLKGRVDKDFLTELEKRLYLADVGTTATSEPSFGAASSPKRKQQKPHE